MIRIVWAPPRRGKTFFVTGEMIRRLKRGRKVFSNYPIVSRDRKYSSKVWDWQYRKEAIMDCEIVMDEAYNDVSSRDFKKFSVEDHAFFATCGHNDINFWLIAQDYSRVDLIIREMCEEYIVVKKYCIPGTEVPLFFTATGYGSEKDMALMDEEKVLSFQFIPFSSDVAKAYDTHYFRNPATIPFDSITWKEKLHVSDIPLPTLLDDIIKSLQEQKNRVALGARKLFSDVKMAVVKAKIALAQGVRNLKFKGDKSP